MTGETYGARGGRRLWLLFVEDGVSPELRGPYATGDARIAAARALIGSGGGEHGVFPVDASGEVEVGVFAASEVE